MIRVKILSIRDSERYVLRRIVQTVQTELEREFPDLQLEISEISDPGQIGSYARVIVLPTLVVNEKVVCSRRMPNREEVATWLRQAL